MAVKLDLRVEGRDVFAVQFHFVVDGVDFDISTDDFEAEIRRHPNVESDVLAEFAQVNDGTGLLTLSLLPNVVEALPKVAFWRLSRLKDGDPGQRRTILEGRLRHD